ncbi:MAG: hypothetical protein U0807_14020 [Candidatus Binatia bacterium]
MDRTRLVLSYALAIALTVHAGTTTAAGRPTRANADATTPARAGAPLTLETLRNARLDCPRTAIRGCFGRVTLRDGVGTTDDGTLVSLLEERVSIGDLDGDPATDAALVVSCWPGGRRVYDVLVVVSTTGATLACRAAESLGAGIGLHYVSIARGTVYVDLTTRGPNDPHACPSQRATRAYQLTAGRLVGTEAVRPTRVSQVLCPES